MKQLGAFICGLISLIVITSTVHAAPSLTIAPFDGNASASAKSEVTQVVMASAKSAGTTAEIGKVSIVDASSAVGCGIAEPDCGNQIRQMLGSDQLVYGEVNGSSPITIKFTVVNERGVVRTETATARSIDSLRGDISPNVATLLGLKSELSLTPDKNAEDKTNGLDSKPKEVSTTRPIAVAGQLDHPSSHNNRRTFAIGGMAFGGGVLVGGILLWAKASSIQGDINRAPTNNSNDIRKLRDLEDRGDSASLWGNVLFFSGAAIAGISGYFFYRDMKESKQGSVAISPYVTNDAAGILVTVGGGL
jgi:hypothetical protein